MTDETTTPNDLGQETEQDDATIAEGAPAEPDAEAPLTRLEAELAEAKQAVLYAQAETQNVRRRAEAEAKTTRDYAIVPFARDILSVADNLQRALDAIPEDLRGDDKFKGLVNGLDATGRELTAIFQRHGITRIDAVGQPLDPNRHQAMMELPSDEPAGTIVQEMQAGYMIKDRLLRPAMVGVAKAG